MGKYNIVIKTIIVICVPVCFFLSGCFFSASPDRFDSESTRGYADDPFEDVRYNARYLFEQVALPSTVINNEKDVVGLISDGKANTIDGVVINAWNKAVEITLFETFSSDDKEYAKNDSDWYNEVIDQKRLEYDLGANHIVDITIEKLSENTNAAILEMRELDWYLLCTYIGIVDDPNEGLRYFTIERSYDSEDIDGNLYMFCFIKGAGVRGSIGLIDNNKQSFIDAIIDEL